MHNGDPGLAWIPLTSGTLSMIDGWVTDVGEPCFMEGKVFLRPMFDTREATTNCTGPSTGPSCLGDRQPPMPGVSVSVPPWPEVNLWGTGPGDCVPARTCCWHTATPLEDVCSASFCMESAAAAFMLGMRLVDSAFEIVRAGTRHEPA
eukprot:CAMPEP_0115231750 /NCGR_PEP_ID=MMETSP0270-20121206/33400_1 /TAXON_ID=71861 /ORGANISM="Scrippsiella trochoidea, Strain CCMP3099" /LENGTH=147 /DNA_ID=CAMNT_0002646399 /DNA_START=136 /DNA_END=579 /DNA_ORIENTATION=-